MARARSVAGGSGEAAVRPTTVLRAVPPSSAPAAREVVPRVHASRHEPDAVRRTRRTAERARADVGPKLLLSVAEAAAKLGMSRAKCYPLVMREDIVSFKDGGRRLIPAWALDEYIESRMAARRSA